jgi:hypothetical protein
MGSCIEFLLYSKFVCRQVFQHVLAAKRVNSDWPSTFSAEIVDY